MKITLDIPDTFADRVIAAISDTYGYQETIRDEEGNEMPNPQTRAQFARSQVLRFLKETTVAYEANREASLAREAAREQADSDIAL